MNCCGRHTSLALAVVQHKGGKMITVTLIGPDEVTSTIEMSEDTTVRDVATYKYHLFWRTTKINGIDVVPFTTTVVDGDTVTVENS